MEDKQVAPATGPEGEVVDDSAVFVENDVPKTVRLVDGKMFQIPPSSFRNELRVTKLIADTLAELAKSDLFKGGGLNGTEAQAAVLNLLFEKTPERLVEVAAAICGQSYEWALDNLDLERGFDLLIPFFKSKRQRIVAAVARRVGSLSAAVAAVQAAMPKSAA